jgi:Uma2 family endonuclease
MPSWFCQGSHDQVVKLPVYERAAVPEVWFVHPIDRTVTIHRLEGGRYAPPTIQALKGTTALKAIPGVSIDRDRLRTTP